MRAKNGFSIVIPTYSGLDHIEQCLNSILEQKQLENYEVVVVIDGSRAIYKIVEAAKSKFIDKNIDFQSVFLKQNRGRFEARIVGAKAAKYDQLLFIDDRVELVPGFFNYVRASKKRAIMPNVLEADATNILSATTSMLRKRIWGSKADTDFDDYYIDSGNFENSPKGTTSLYINKKVFLVACDKVGESLAPSNTSRISDDTKILRQIVEDGTEILRTSALQVNYVPRRDFSEAWRHLFWRGPKFVDYYHRPGTRFFPLLAVVYLSAVAVVVLAIFYPLGLLYAALAYLAMAILLSLIIARNIEQFFTALIGLPLTIVTFSAGILVGTLLKIIGR